MVKQISATIKVEVTESDDAKHRYVLYKEWDKDKPTCTIITLFPGSAELVITDTTCIPELCNDNHSKNRCND